IPDLTLKMGVRTIAPERLARLAPVAHHVAELVNLAPNPQQPYVGQAAFATKAGLHTSAMARGADLYQHVPPEAVANAKRIVATAEWNGPVNALDAALRQAISSREPAVAGLHLTDYKVRVLDTAKGTAAVTRVLIDSTDGERTWSTMGVSENIIEASWRA